MLFRTWVKGPHAGPQALLLAFLAVPSPLKLLHASPVHPEHDIQVTYNGLTKAHIHKQGHGCVQCTARGKENVSKDQKPALPASFRGELTPRGCMRKVFQVAAASMLYTCLRCGLPPPLACLQQQAIAAQGSEKSRSLAMIFLKPTLQVPVLILLQSMDPTRHPPGAAAGEGRS